jgi:hypothetical protein
VTYEAPAIEARADVGGPLIGNPVGSPPLTSPAWSRTDDEPEESE